MKPLIEEIEKVISLRGLDQTEITDIAQAIHALFNPPIKPLSELSSPEILAEIEHIKQQVDIISERRLNLEREMFFRNNPDVNP